ncbi:MAG TPA: hypothetical protein VIH78_06705 [Terriglobales bacterium]
MPAASANASIFSIWLSLAVMFTLTVTSGASTFTIEPAVFQRPLYDVPACLVTSVETIHTYYTSLNARIHINTHYTMTGIGAAPPERVPLY